MNYLFLDMDGVLNSDTLIREWFDKKKEQLSKEFDTPLELHRAVRQVFNSEFRHCTELVMPELAELLSTIVTECNVDIIWSTTWRKLLEYRDLESAKKMFNRRNLPGDRLIGYTPDFSYFRRPFNEVRVKEINSVIYNKQFGISNKSKIAVLDDMDLSGIDNGKNIRFFQTTMKDGLTKEIADDIISFYKGV